MHIEYMHASKYGNGADVAEQFRAHMAQRGVDVDVHHIHEVDPHRVAQADLHVFSSPGRMGRPRGTMRRFLKKLSLPAGTPYAVLTTEVAPRPDKKTGRLPTEEERARRQHVRPIMDELGAGAWHGEPRRGLCVCHRAEGAARGRVAGQGRRVRGPHPSQQLIRSKPRTRALSCASTMHDGRRHGRCGEPGWAARMLDLPRIPWPPPPSWRASSWAPSLSFSSCWCSAPPLGRFAGGGQQVAGLDGAARPVRRRRPRLRLSQQDGDAAHEAGGRCWSLPCASRSLRQGEQLPVPLGARRATRRLAACPTAAPGWPSRWAVAAAPRVQQ